MLPKSTDHTNESNDSSTNHNGGAASLRPKEPQVLTHGGIICTPSPLYFRERGLSDFHVAPFCSPRHQELQSSDFPQARTAREHGRAKPRTGFDGHVPLADAST